MIPRAIWIGVLFLLRLIIPGQPPRKRIDPLAPCKACGNIGGEIKTIRRGDKLFVEHTCDTCKARWPEDLITDPATTVIKAFGDN